MAKLFIIDANVLLQDPDSIYKFEDNDIVIPMGVIEELDKFKKEVSEVGRNARKVARALDDLRNDGTLTEGIKVNNGTLRVVYDGDQKRYKEAVDLQILHIAQKLTEEHTDKECIIVTRDVNIRLRADALGLKAENYRGNLIDTDKMTKGYDEILLDAEAMDILGDKHVYDDIDLYGFLPNQYLIIKEDVNPKHSLLGKISSDGESILTLKPLPDKLQIKPQNKEQHFALDALLDPNIKLVSLIGRAGSGKAQPLDAKILTPNGWSTMGEMKKGTIISTSDGSSAKVSSVHPQGVKKIYKITFTDGSSTECCEDHLWLTQTQKDRDYKRIGTVKPLKEIMKTLRYSYANKRNHSIPIASPVYYEEHKTIIDPYIMGLILGDGHIGNSSISFTNVDSEIINEMSNFVEKMDMNMHKQGDGISYYLVKKRIDGKRQPPQIPNPLVLEMQRLKLSGTLSYNKFIPEEFLINSFENRVSLLQGLMDSDGCICKNGCVSYTSTSKQLAENVRTLVQSLGGTARIKSRTTRYTYKGVKKEGAVSYRMCICLDNTITPFRLTRKKERLQKRTRYFPRRYIDTVEYVGDKDAQCIIVDCDNHLYITDDFIVTHNTLLAVAAAYYSTITLNGTSHYSKMLVSRPVMPMGRDIGFLPGEVSEKLDPWMQPIYDSLNVLTGKGGKNIAEKYADQIGIEPLTYIRGRSIHNQFMIVDEAQQLMPLEVKTILTRVSHNTKIVLTGDIDQIDNPYVDRSSNGLITALQAFKSSPVAAHIMLDKGVRSDLAEEASRLL